MKKSNASISSKESITGAEVRELDAALRKAIRRPVWSEFASDHDDLVNETLADAIRTYRGDNGASRLTHALSILENKAKRLAAERRRAKATGRRLKADADATQNDHASHADHDPIAARREKSNASLYFASGRRREARRKTELSEDELRKLGDLHARLRGQLANYIQGGFLFAPGFEGTHYKLIGRLIEAEFGRVPPRTFVRQLIACRIDLVPPEWIESSATAEKRVPGRGRPSGRAKAGPERSNGSVFREKHRSAGSRLAAAALRLCGFSTDEIFARERKESAAESRWLARWAGKMTDAISREGGVDDDRFLELALETLPARGAAGEFEGTAGRHPAFRRKPTRRPNTRE